MTEAPNIDHTFKQAFGMPIIEKSYELNPNDIKEEIAELSERIMGLVEQLAEIC